MNTENKTHVVTDAEPQRSTCEGASDDVVRRPMPSRNGARPKRLETQDEIERALHIASTRYSRTSHRVVVVLVALVVICLVMAAIVWWRLLT